MKKVVIPTAAALMTVCLLCAIWIFFAPGFMSYDSMVQYKSALAQQYADSHPPIMSYLWHVCLQLVPGPESLLYFHLFLLATGVFIWQCNLKSPLGKLVLPLLFFLPWIFNFTGVLWKDVGMAYALLAATGILFGSWKKRRYNLFAIPFLFYGLAVRHNAILAVVPILFFAVRVHFPRLNIWMSGVATIVLTAVLSGAVSVVTYGFIGAEKKHFETFLMGDEIAKISAMTHQNLMPWIKEDDLQACSVPPILYERALCFISKGYDPSGSLVVDLPVASTYALWEKAIVSSPLTYASVRLEAFMYFLRSPTLEPQAGWFPGIMKNDLGIELARPQMESSLERYVLGSQATVLGEFFKPYLWLVLAFLITIAAMLMPRSPARTQLLVLNTSALGCFVSLLIAVPSVDFRYIYWCVIATTLSVPLLVSAIRRPEPVVE